MTRVADEGRTLSSAVTTVALLLGGFACGGASPAGPSASALDPGVSVSLTPVAPTAEWPSSTPAAEGIDPARLVDVLNRIRRGEYGRINSLLVARHGRLVMEEYFNGWTAGRAHTQQSATNP